MDKMTAIITAIIVGLALILGVGSRFWLHKTDNIIEETAEKVIEKQTGYNVDISPDTPDNVETPTDK
jgi:hypothetical protein